MARPKPDKTALLSALAEHVLATGLAASSLRPLAAAIGTSDRMLIYHFGSKDALMAEVLMHLAARMAAGLDAALPEQRFASEAALVRAVVTLVRTPQIRPFMRVWLEVVAATGRDRAMPQDIGNLILGSFLTWVEKRHPDGAAGAPRTLALIEGVLVMDAAGGEAVSNAAMAALDDGRRERG